MESQRNLLESGIKHLDLTLSSRQVDLLLDYLGLFVKWNKAYNLSAIRDVDQMVIKHLLDSLTVIPYVTAERLADVGTGGGLPGIPLAIAYPEKHFTLIDSAGKKTRFLFQVAQQLKLSNVEVLNCRVEAYQPNKKYDAVFSRAFASLRNMTASCQHLLGEGGKFLAMKGVFPEEELSELDKHYKVDSTHQLHVPGLSGERCLVVISSPTAQLID